MSLRNTLEEPPVDERPVRVDHDAPVVEVPDGSRRTRRVLIGAAVGLVLAVAAYLLFVREPKPATGPAGGAGPVAATAAPVAISSATAVERELPVYLEASGSLTPYETTDVAPEVAGQVVATPVDAGSFVARGAVLARLDDRDARLRVQAAEAAVEQAEAALRKERANLGLARGEALDPTRVAEVESARANMELAEANERRYRSLVESGDVSRAQYDEFKARAETARKAYETQLAKARSGGASVDVQASAVSAARAQLATARKALADTVITAPLAGYVADRPTAVGEWVTTASKIATIVQSDRLKLLLQVSEADAARVRMGMPATLRVDAYPGRDFTGQVAAIIPALDSASRSLTVVVGVVNADGALKPGMFATTKLLEPALGRTGVVVPRESVIRNASGTAIVYVVADDRAIARPVQVGQEIDGMIHVVEGVKAGEEVVTVGADKLEDGAPIIKGSR
jgi:multidrug efflux pump subunit AcrA (membrane-fusion protein)